jgi:hypothetical protein
VFMNVLECWKLAEININLLFVLKPEVNHVCLKIYLLFRYWMLFRNWKFGFRSISFGLYGIIFWDYSNNWSEEIWGDCW